MKIKISPVIAHEYAVRCIFDCVGGAGVYDLDAATIVEIRDDAEFYTHRKSYQTADGEHSAYRGILKQIYRGLLKQIAEVERTS